MRRGVSTIPEQATKIKRGVNLKKHESKKFVVYGVPRVGSNLFISEINKHSEILCHYEIFGKKSAHYGYVDKGIEDKEVDSWIDRHNCPLAFLNKVWENSKNFKAVGYNLFPKQNETAFYDSLMDKRQKKIILKRKDMLRNYVSLKIASKTGKWSQRSQENSPKKKIDLSKKKILFDRFDFIRHVCDVNSFYYILETTLGLTRQNYITIFYEDIADSDLYEKTMENVFSFLEVNIEELGTIKKNDKKYKKQNEENLKDLVTNYFELKKYLSLSKYNINSMLIFFEGLDRINMHHFTLRNKFDFKYYLRSICYGLINFFRRN